MTAPLPDRIAAAIDNYRARCRTLDEADCYGSMDRASYDEQRKGVLDARDALSAAIAEVYAEREQYRAVVARQIEDKRRLLAERKEARAVLALVAGNLAAWAEKREEAPESAGDHMDEAMHALVRFRPDGDYSEAASKLRLEMWRGEVYAERDAATKRADRLADELAIANDLIASARHDVGERSFLEDAQRILQGCVAPYSCEQMKAVADALRQWRDKWAILLETVVRSNEERDKALADLAAALADRSIRDAEADGRRIERMSADLAAAQAKLAEVEKERAYYKLVSEGWPEDDARGEVWPNAAEQGGAP